MLQIKHIYIAYSIHNVIYFIGAKKLCYEYTPYVKLLHNIFTQGYKKH